MSKKLGHFIIKCDTTEQLHREHALLEKKLNEKYFDEHIVNNISSYSFSHIFVKDITMANFKNSGQPYIKLNLYADFGDRYEKADIVHFTKLIERILKREIKFKSLDNETKSFFENTPVLYNKIELCS